MKKIKFLSVEELLDQLESLEDQRGNGGNYLLQPIISIEIALLQRIKEDPTSDYMVSLPKIEQDLIEHLVKYGTYLKTEYRKDDGAAKSSLIQALRYDKTIPQAHYRLGFIAYKEKNYKGALRHFQNAVESQQLNPEHKLHLSNQQSYHALLYLSNSALYLATEAQKQSNDISQRNDVEETRFERLTLSPLYELIDSNTGYLEQHVLQLTDCGGIRGGSWEEYEEMIDVSSRKELILDMTGREIWARYKGIATKLTILNAELLRTLMVNSDECSPLGKERLSDLFSTKKGEIKIERYVKNVSRLREKLLELRLPVDIIGMVPKALNGQDTSYYYRALDVPFLLIEHSEGGQ